MIMAMWSDEAHGWDVYSTCSRCPQGLLHWIQEWDCERRNQQFSEAQAVSIVQERLERHRFVGKDGLPICYACGGLGSRGRA